MENNIREMIDKVKNFNPQIINENKDKNQAILLRSMTPFWIGTVNTLDGEIEEIHTYEEAQQHDFHHSYYFSNSQIEKIDQEECMVFWVDNHELIYEWTRGIIHADIVYKINQQIRIV